MRTVLSPPALKLAIRGAGKRLQLTIIALINSRKQNERTEPQSISSAEDRRNRTEGVLVQRGDAKP